MDEGEPVAAYPSAPQLDLASPPRLISALDIAKLGSKVKGNLARRAQWCPDGSAALVTTEDRLLRLYNTSDVPTGHIFDNPAQTYQLPDAVVSTAWYPSASIKTTPEAFCFAAAVRDSPTRLIDGFTGMIRATYPIVDHRERVVAAHSMAFNPSGNRLHCGHDSAIEVFDITRPGDAGERIKTSRTRKEKGGLKGIVSALAFCTDYSGLYAAGTYSSQAALYMEDGTHPVSHLEGIAGGGVTQVAFHPLVPETLFVASRRSDVIQVYDTRDTSQPVLSLERKGMTNQRIWFDVDPWGRWLVSGDQNGHVRFWDINNLGEGEAAHDFKLHNDVVGSVQLHPLEPWLLTASGSRDSSRAVPPDADSNDIASESDITDSDSGSEVSLPPSHRVLQYGQPTWSAQPGDASVCLWSLGSSSTPAAPSSLPTIGTSQPERA